MRRLRALTTAETEPHPVGNGVYMYFSVFYFIIFADFHNRRHGHSCRRYCKFAANSTHFFFLLKYLTRVEDTVFFVGGKSRKSDTEGNYIITKYDSEPRLD